jgi:hypothetical protein
MNVIDYIAITCNLKKCPITDYMKNVIDYNRLQLQITINPCLRSAVLCMGTMGSCPVVPQANEPHANLCMLYTAIFFIFEHWFCWKYQYKKYMVNFIDHL